MALTANEEAYAKDLYTVKGLQKQIKQAEKTAKTALDAKRAEITAIQNQLTIDIAALQAQIDAIL